MPLGAYGPSATDTRFTNVFCGNPLMANEPSAAVVADAKVTVPMRSCTCNVFPDSGVVPKRAIPPTPVVARDAPGSQVGRGVAVGVNTGAEVGARAVWVAVG